MPFIGHVYRIEFPDGHFYIGSTKQKLGTRLSGHKNDRTRGMKDRKSEYIPTTRFDIYLTKNGWNNPTITSVQQYEVNSLSELHDFERELIKIHIGNPKILNEVCRGSPPSEIRRLCKLERLLERQERGEKPYFLQCWIEDVLENWFKTPFFTGSSNSIHRIIAENEAGGVLHSW